MDYQHYTIFPFLSQQPFASNTGLSQSRADDYVLV